MQYEEPWHLGWVVAGSLTLQQAYNSPYLWVLEHYNGHCQA